MDYGGSLYGGQATGKPARGKGREQAGGHGGHGRQQDTDEETRGAAGASSSSHDTMSGGEVVDERVTGSASSLRKLRSLRAEECLRNRCQRLERQLAAERTHREEAEDRLRQTLQAHNGLSEDPDIVQRLLAQVPCMQAQKRAAAEGRSSHTSSGLVTSSLHVTGTAGRHEFKHCFLNMTPQQARKLQRGAREPRVASGGAARERATSNSGGNSATHSGPEQVVRSHFGSRFEQLLLVPATV